MSYRLYEEAKEKFCEALAEIVEGKQRFNADDLRLAKEAISGLYKATILMEMENGNYSRDYSYRYSRDEAKKDMAEEIKELMQYAENETERSVLRQAAEMLKNNAEK